VAGAFALWGNAFGWNIALAVSAFVTWYCARTGSARGGRVMLAWQHKRRANGTLLLWHNGMTGGYASWCGIVREEQIAVVVLSNSASNVDALGEQILAGVSDLATDAD
jgi:CubicO group peptidase (beta-lactamase class C family)